MTIEQLEKDIKNVVDYHLTESILDYIQEYRKLASRKEILKMFFSAVSELIWCINNEYEEEEEEEE